MKVSKKNTDNHHATFKLLQTMMLRAFRNYPGYITLMIFFLVIQSVFTTYQLYIQKDIFTAVSKISTVSLWSIIYLILFYFAIRSITNIFNVCYALISGRFGPEFDKFLRVELLKKYTKLHLIDYEEDEIYNNILKAKNSCLLATDTLKVFIEMVIGQFMKIFGIVAYFTVIKPQLLFVVLIAMLPEIFKIKMNQEIEYRRNNVLAPLSRRSNYLYDVMTKKGFFTELRIQNCIHFLKELWEKAKDEEYVESRKTMKIDFIIQMLSKTIYFLFYISTLLLTSYYLYKKEISIGQFAVTLTGVEYIRTILNQLLNNLDQISKRGVSIQNYYDFLDIKEAEGKREVCYPIHQIDFDNVSFHYSNGKNILSNLNITIHQGETIAIIGGNGAGKTTFAKLILGFLQPTTGTVRYNNKEISKIAEIDLFQHSSILFQTFGRYQFTLAENIILDEHIDQKKLVKADSILKKIGFDMNDRYTLDTMLGTDFGGVDLSGGQWQQLSLARAYYKDSEFIVLDEPTSAIDPIKESELLSNFREICKMKTAILITHRLSAAKLADRILVMEQGKIIEMGTHDELMSKNHIYAKMYNEQASWYRR